MSRPISDTAHECPIWCAGHDDDQEPTPPHWHRSEGIIVSVVERRRAVLGGNPAALLSEDFVVALEQDAQATYVYIGPLEDGTRFFAITRDGATRLQIAIASLLGLGT